MCPFLRSVSSRQLLFTLFRYSSRQHGVLLLAHVGMIAIESQAADVAHASVTEDALRAGNIVSQMLIDLTVA